MRHLLALIPVLALASWACSGGSSTLSDSGPVLSEIPWTVPETARYRVLNGDDVIGSAQLSIEGSAAAPALASPPAASLAAGSLLYTQRFDFPGQNIKDSASVVADSDSLRPRAVTRRIDGPEGPRTCDARYESGKVTVQQQANKDQRTDTVDVPKVSYDTWTDLFLWRTLAFAPGFKVNYQGVLTCSLAKPDVIPVVLEVTAREQVTVPAGTFDAWRLEIGSGGKTQKAWFTADEKRMLVRYDNSELVFELEPLE